MGITHATVATGTDAGTGEIHKAQWNADHVIATTGARYPVQSGSVASASSTTRTITWGAAPTNGNYLVIGTVSEGTGSVSSVVQTNVSWTKLAQSTAGVAPVIEIWGGVVSASAGTTTVITWSDSTFHSSGGGEWTSITGTVDTSAQRHATNDPTNLHTIAILTAGVQTALVFAGVSTTSNGTTFSSFSGVAMMPVVTGITIGLYYGFPGTFTTVYGAASGGSSATASACTVSIT